jgi:hypothetical protein
VRKYSWTGRISIYWLSSWETLWSPPSIAGLLRTSSKLGHSVGPIGVQGSIPTWSKSNTTIYDLDTIAIYDIIGVIFDLNMPEIFWTYWVSLWRTDWVPRPWGPLYTCISYMEITPPTPSLNWGDGYKKPHWGSHCPWPLERPTSSAPWIQAWPLDRSLTLWMEDQWLSTTDGTCEMGSPSDTKSFMHGCLVTWLPTQWNLRD